MRPRVNDQTGVDAVGRAGSGERIRAGILTALKSVFLTVLIVGLHSSTAAAEPAYCDPHHFTADLQVPVTEGGRLVRVHAFKLGSVVLVGTAVGSSDPQALIRLAESAASTSIDQDRYCTWYYNRGHWAPDGLFNHVYVPSPFIVTSAFPKILKMWDQNIAPPLDPLNMDDMIQTYKSNLKEAFSDHPGDSFLYCARKYHYLAMGCNDQKQRGPTVFGALLAFSGCSPEHALAIVDTLWSHSLALGAGTDIQIGARARVISAFHQWGLQNPQVSGALEKIFSGKD